MTDQPENIPSESPEVPSAVPKPKKGWNFRSVGKKAIVSLAALAVIVGGISMCHGGSSTPEGSTSGGVTTNHQGSGAAPGPAPSAEPGIG